VRDFIAYVVDVLQMFSIANPNAADEFNSKAQSFILSGVSCLVFSGTSI